MRLKGRHARIFGPFAIVDAWAFMRWGTFDRIELQLTAASLVIATTLNATILFLYGWLLEAACGATLGKVLVGSRVVRTTQRGALAACAVARFSEDCRRPRLLSGGDYRGSVFRGAAANRRYVRAYSRHRRKIRDCRQSECDRAMGCDSGGSWLGCPSNMLSQ